MEKNRTKPSLIYTVLKNVLDRSLSLILLLTLIIIPVIPVTAIFIKMTSEGPVFYKQRRIGQNGQEFEMFKFRSMYVGFDKYMMSQIKDGKTNPLQFKESAVSGYTKVGSFIRKTSIDELPQLINIMKGDMSVVGPRPLQKFEKEEFISKSSYNKEIMLIRQSIKPGLLCYWQVDKDKDKMSFENRMEMDKKYCESQSLITDFNIIIRGIKVILSSKNK